MDCLSIVCQAQFVQALDTDGNGKLDYMEFVNAFQIPNNLSGTHNQDYYVAAHFNSTNSRPSSGASGNRAVWKSALGRHALVGGESLCPDKTGRKARCWLDVILNMKVILAPVIWTSCSL